MRIIIASAQVFPLFHGSATHITHKSLELKEILQELCMVKLGKTTYKLSIQKLSRGLEGTKELVVLVIVSILIHTLLTLRVSQPHYSKTL